MQETFNITEDCITSDKVPSKKLEELSRETWFGSYPFSMLLEQKSTRQPPLYHPEGSVWNHTLLVVDEAAKRKNYSSDPRTFMWAALLHDIGKPAVTKIRKGKITAYGHDVKGAELAREFLSMLTDERDFISGVAQLVLYHMQILYVEKGLPFQDIEGVKKNTNVIDTALLCYCDRLGRAGVNRSAEREKVLAFLNKCNERTDVPWLKPE